MAWLASITPPTPNRQTPIRNWGKSSAGLVEKMADKWAHSFHICLRDALAVWAVDLNVLLWAGLAIALTLLAIPFALHRSRCR